MSAIDGLPTPLPSVESGGPNPRADALPTLCPYLATLDGTWRSASATREHHCMAVAPPVHLAPEKQRRLCLVAAHVDCATYGAAVAARAGPSDRFAGHSRPIARTTPIVLDQGGLDLRIPAVGANRASGQVVLVGLLGIAFLAILIARPAGNPGPAGGPGADASASTRPSAGATTDVAAAPTTDAPTDTPAPTPTPAAAESVAPSSAPSGVQPTATASSVPSSPPPASSQPATSGATYRVRSGDTLSAIAARFGTTTKVLVDLNGISDPSKLRIGQVLRLP